MPNSPEVVNTSVAGRHRAMGNRCQIDSEVNLLIYLFPLVKVGTMIRKSGPGSGFRQSYKAALPVHLGIGVLAGSGNLLVIGASKIPVYFKKFINRRF